MSPVVIVPVLSRQSTSTRASTSTADSCFASALRRAKCDDSGHERKAREQHEPIGHHRHRGSNRAEERVLPVVLGREQIHEQEHRRDPE